MAVITAADLAGARRGWVGDNVSATLTKPQLNAALQAIEDAFEAARPTINAAINTAIAPATLSPSQRRQLVREWASIKFRLGG